MKNAVFLDIAAKQNYIFSSNKLKDIIGASGIIALVSSSDYIRKFMSENMPKVAMDGVFGGGNALLFFDEKSVAKNFIKQYSKDLLLNFPSLVPYFALNCKFDEQNYAKSVRETHEMLDELKNSFFPLTQPLTLGIESLCPNSDFSVTCEDRNPENFKEKIRISSATFAKRNFNISANFKSNFKREKLKTFDEICESALKNKYEFSDELDKIYYSENGFIAVSHIDANKLGERLKGGAIDDKLTATKFSNGIDKAMQKTLNKTVEILIAKLEKGFKFGDGVEFSQKDLKLHNDKMILPFCPIILSGDDFTFVSEGRLGILISEIFINELKNHRLNDDNSEFFAPLFASGGVAIIKAKSPFFRAYEICEELASSAKTLTRAESPAKTSIDFMISSANVSLGSLDLMRENYFSKDGKKLYNGGYSLDENGDFSELLSLMQKLSKLSKNKVMKLRELAFVSFENAKRFIEIYCGKNSNLLTKIDGETQLNFKKEMLLDAIEMLNFYPNDLGEKK
ncbi:MAG: hypothetical protein MR902_07070 [Campylobacter sp.]|nr:hypothetical protein [Campylobacter sp.]